MKSNETKNEFSHNFRDTGDDKCCLMIYRKNSDGRIIISDMLHGDCARYVVGKMVAANRQASRTQADTSQQPRYRPLGEIPESKYPANASPELREWIDKNSNTDALPAETERVNLYPWHKNAAADTSQQPDGGDVATLEEHREQSFQLGYEAAIAALPAPSVVGEDDLVRMIKGAVLELANSGASPKELPRTIAKHLIAAGVINGGGNRHAV